MLLGILSPWTPVSIWGDLYWTWQSWVKVCGLRRCMGHGSEKRKQLLFRRFITNGWVQGIFIPSTWFLSNKGHADASCHMMMYHFLRGSKVPFRKSYHQFSCHPKKLLLEMHCLRMHIVVYLMPSTFPRIGMILDEFRFGASGVSWKMGPTYKDL